MIIQELDDIMEDLIVGHNFNYARQAIINWHNANLHKAIGNEEVEMPNPNKTQMIQKGL